MNFATSPIGIPVDGHGIVSGLLIVPDQTDAVFVFAHGAGAGMNHSFMSSFASVLASRNVATLRYQFPYMERGSRRPDSPAVAHAAVGAAVNEVAARMPGMPLFAGGKSFGGRMTTQAQAASQLADVRGIVLVGFPLHPAGKPSIDRAEHLARVSCPMLFLQGSRDELAELGLLTGVVERLGSRATLKVFDDADHAFHVRARSGTSDALVLESMTRATAEWMASVAKRH